MSFAPSHRGDEPLRPRTVRGEDRGATRKSRNVLRAYVTFLDMREGLVVAEPNEERFEPGTGWMYLFRFAHGRSLMTVDACSRRRASRLQMVGRDKPSAAAISVWLRPSI